MESPGFVSQEGEITHLKLSNWHGIWINTTEPDGAEIFRPKKVIISQLVRPKNHSEESLTVRLGSLYQNSKAKKDLILTAMHLEKDRVKGAGGLPC